MDDMHEQLGSTREPLDEPLDEQLESIRKLFNGGADEESKHLTFEKCLQLSAFAGWVASGTTTVEALRELWDPVAAAHETKTTGPGLDFEGFLVFLGEVEEQILLVAGEGLVDSLGPVGDEPKVPASLPNKSQELLGAAGQEDAVESKSEDEGDDEAFPILRGTPQGSTFDAHNPMKPWRRPSRVAGPGTLNFSRDTDPVFKVGDVVTIRKKFSSKQGMRATVLDADYSDNEDQHMVKVKRRDGQISLYLPEDLVNDGGASAIVAKKESKKSKVDEASLDPVKFGDLIYLRPDMFEGILMGDVARGQCGVMAMEGEPRNFEDSLFRIYPPLGYRVRSEYRIAKRSEEEKRKARATKRPLTPTVDGDAAFETEDKKVMKEERTALQILNDRLRMETDKNVQTVEEIHRAGAQNDVVKYGSHVQLLHVQSGKWLSCHEDAAHMDRDCRRVSLKYGSFLDRKIQNPLDPEDESVSLFHFMPRFKAQSVGSTIYFTHNLKLGSTKSEGLWVHADTNPDFSLSQLCHPMDPTLDQCLRTVSVYEANCSPKELTMKIERYQRPGDVAGRLLTLEPFRLFHSQSESFLQASCNPEKDPLPGKNIREVDQKEGSHLSMSLVRHIPYLKRLDGHGNDDPDPKNPAYQTSKGVWAFENLDRSAGSAIKWGTPVRIRHVASRKFLAVIPQSVSVKTDDGRDAKWYSTLLVDDDEQDPKQDVAEAPTWANGKLVMPLASLSFLIRPSEATELPGPPKGDCNLLVAHELPKSKTLIFMQNTEKEKREKRGFSASLRVVFSDVTSNKDLVRVMPVAETEANLMASLQSFITPVCTYANTLRRPAVKILEDDMGRLANNMLSIILLLMETAPEIDMSIDWIAEANSMMPLEFCNKFVRSCNPMAQRIAREIKLMDAVFLAASAPYERTQVSRTNVRPFGATVEQTAPEIVGPRGIQKLIHVILQKLTQDDPKSQKYFATRSLRNVGADEPEGPRVPSNWMQNILVQLVDPLGGLVTLSLLLSNNEKLLKEVVSPDLVLDLQQLVRDNGPEPRLMQFFSSICRVGSKPIKANQEMILRLLIFEDDVRRTCTIELFAGDPDGLLTKKATKETIKAPRSYILKEEAEGRGLPVPYVRWFGDDNWAPNTEALFWSPSALGLETARPLGQKTVWERGNPAVRLDRLAWILEPQRLCLPCTGKEWHNVEYEIAENPEGELALRLSRARQLTNFFVEQLLLFSEMTAGRSYNCIAHLQKMLPYALLVSMADAELLPYKIRATSMKIIQSLYLDRYPQLSHCGKPSLPELLWIYDSGTEGANIPVIRKMKMNEDETNPLPKFVINSTHPFHGDADKLKSFPNDCKFFLVRKLASDLVSGANKQVASQESLNRAMSSAVAIVSDMLSFGFLSNIDKISLLALPLTQLLDGRTDEAQPGIPFEPLTERYKKTDLSEAVTSTKSAILDVLMTICDIRANFRSGQLLNFFKQEICKKHDSELHLFSEKNAAYPETGPLYKLEFDEVEKYFKDDADAMMLSLDKLSNQNMKHLLMDTLMYEDDTLFEKALKLLNREFAQRKKLVGAMNAVVLISSDIVPVYGNVETMLSDLGYLLFIMRSYEVWAVSNKVAGESFDNDRVQRCHKSLNDAKMFLLSTPPDGAPEEKGDDEGLFVNPLFQNVGQAVNMQAVIIAGLAIDYNLVFYGSVCSNENKLKSREILTEALREVILLAIPFVHSNPANQRLLINKLSLMREHIGPLKLPGVWPEHFGPQWQEKMPTVPSAGIEPLIIECIRGNKDICSEMLPAGLFEDFGLQLEAEAKDISTSSLLDFFTIACRPDGPRGSPLSKNQETAINVITSDRLKRVRSAVNSFIVSAADGLEEKSTERPRVTQPERICKLLSSIIQHNPRTAHMLNARTDIGIDSTLTTLAATITAIRKRIRGTTGLTRAAAKSSHRMNSVSIVGGLEASSMNPIVGESEEEEIDELEVKAGKAMLSNPFCLQLTELLAHLMSTLVVDPRIFRQDSVWTVFTNFFQPVLFNLGEASTALDMLSLEHCLFLRHAVKVLSLVTKRARDLNLGTKMAMMDSNPLSVFDSLGRIFHKDNDGNMETVEVLNSDSRSQLLDILKAIRPQDQTVAGIEEIIENPKVLPGPTDAYDVNDPFKDHDTDGQRAVPRGSVQVRRGWSDKSKSAKPSLLNSLRGIELPNLEDASVRDKFDVFRQSLQQNPLIKQKLQARRFELIRILETAKEASAIGPSKKKEKSDEPVRRVSFTKLPTTEPLSYLFSWEDLVKRFVRFATDHNFDEDESTNCLIFNVFRSYICAARGHEDGSLIEAEVLESEDKEKFDTYVKNQKLLNRLGVTDVVLLAVATHPANIEGNSADHALELLTEMVRLGNTDVQHAVADYILKDMDSRLLRHLKHRLEDAISAVKLRKEEVREAFVVPDIGMEERLGNAIQTMKLLQQLCEGHFLRLQNLLREQPQRVAQTNLVELVNVLLKEQANNDTALRRQGPQEVQLLTTTLDCLIELMQGPCEGNQNLIVMKGSETIDIIKNILSSSLSSQTSDIHSLHVIRIKSLILLAAANELRQDDLVRNAIGNEMPPTMLLDAGQRILQYAEELEDAYEVAIAPESFTGCFSACKKELMGGDEREKLRDELEEKCTDASDGLVAYAYLFRNLKETPIFAAGTQALGKSTFDVESDETEGDGEDSQPRNPKADKKRQLGISRFINDVEIIRNGHVESVSFRVPREMTYFSPFMKKLFLERTDLSTVEKRMEALCVKEVDVLMAEMHQKYTLATRSNLYKFINKYFVSIKLCMYALVILLNLNVVMASYSKLKGGNKNPGYSSAWEAQFDRETEGGEFDRIYQNSLNLTWLLGMINLLGYIIITLFLALTEIPIIIHQTDNKINEAKANPLEPKRDPSAFNAYAVTFIFNIFFILMHRFNYPNDPNPRLNLVLTLGINGPWTLNCVRKYILVPWNNVTRLFVILFDTFITKPFLRNHLVLVTFSMVGFQNSTFFTIMLLDIVNNSSLLLDIFLAICDPLPKLALLLYFMSCVAMIYAAFGLEFLPDVFTFGDDEDTGCYSTVACTWLILYKAVPAGSLEEIVNTITNQDGGSDYLFRVLFDITFWIVIGQLLFNVITGLIFDAFSARREKATHREDVLDNSCFVCGFQRDAYDDLHLPSPTFDEHRDLDHDKWAYLAFVVHLKRKDRADYTGVETYVSDLLEDGNLSWVPLRTSFALKNMQASVDQERQDAAAAAATGEDAIMSKLASLEAKLGNLEKGLKAVSENTNMDVA